MKILPNFIQSSCDRIRIIRSSYDKELKNILELDSYTSSEISKILLQAQDIGINIQRLSHRMQTHILLHKDSVEQEATMGHISKLKSIHTNELLWVMREYQDFEANRVQRIKNMIEKDKKWTSMYPRYGQINNIFTGSVAAWEKYKESISPIFQPEFQLVSAHGREVDEEDTAANSFRDNKSTVYCKAVFTYYPAEKDGLDITLKGIHINKNHVETIKLLNKSIAGQPHRTLVHLRDIIKPEFLEDIMKI